MISGIESSNSSSCLEICLTPSRLLYKALMRSQYLMTILGPEITTSSPAQESGKGRRGLEGRCPAQGSGKSRTCQEGRCPAQTSGKGRTGLEGRCPAQKSGKGRKGLAGFLGFVCSACAFVGIYHCHVSMIEIYDLS